MDFWYYARKTGFSVLRIQVRFSDNRFGRINYCVPFFNSFCFNSLFDNKRLYLFFFFPLNLARLIWKSILRMVFVNLLDSVGLQYAARSTPYTHLLIQSTQSYHVLAHYSAMYTVHDTHTWYSKFSHTVLSYVGLRAEGSVINFGIVLCFAIAIVHVWIF